MKGYPSFCFKVYAVLFILFFFVGKEWLLRLCLKSVEKAGAAIIKLMQVRGKVEFVGV